MRDGSLDDRASRRTDGARGLTIGVAAGFVATEKLQENYGKPTQMSSG